MDRIKQKLLLLAIALLFVIVSFYLTAGFNPVFVLAQETTAGSDEEIDDTKGDIKKTEKKLKEEAKKLERYEGDLNRTQGAINTTQAEINKTDALIEETEETISRKEQELVDLNKRIEAQKKILTRLMQEMYYGTKDPLFNITIKQSGFSQMLGGEDYILTLEDKVNSVIGGIKDSKKKIKEDKEELSEEKESQENLLVVKETQQKILLGEKVETKTKIVKKEASISELQSKLQDLKSDLSKLTGKSYSAKNIREAVAFASKNTGVPKGVLYGFLKKETNLGANTGQCTYKKVEKVAVDRYKKLLKKNKKWQSSINLLYKRKAIFYEIVKSLGYSKKKKVSCSPSGYIGQGGAMGVSQFMSDVWRGYESRIAAETGNRKPDPWSLTDGVMAMAIKLKNAGATSSKKSVIRKASINYLGVFNRNYYEGIVYWSKNYKRLFQ